MLASLPEDITERARVAPLGLIGLGVLYVDVYWASLTRVTFRL